MTTSENERALVNVDMKNLPFHKFFVFELRDLYWAEKHIIDSLPKMIQAATSPELKDALDKHLEETDGHKIRLEKAFEALGEDVKDTKCKAMSGILKECEDIISETEEGSAVRDAGIIMAAQKVEHYEITSYGSLIAFSKLMGHDEVTQLLQATLAEEENANSTLTDLAENGINEDALDEK